ncbi:N-acetylmuramidase family protein [Pseudomonas sp. FP2338]|uniref:N-acetylmuramidase family protein n=1 Tax=Pseudomonas sp. FP2338 TaxID=2954093 RepID=UPI00273660AB|nr:N-acetylmuramidase family protein [Pseudomonas sp. FP2338]WLH83325.1 N-acetylmuramidase family protein [Pseudomonas sp. FP2338]
MSSLPVLPAIISASVGTPGKAQNLPADVRCIQHLFNLIEPAVPLVEDGKCGPLLLQRISDYQANRLKVSKPDGVIDPGGRTFKSLVDDAAKANTVVPADPPLISRPTCDGQIALTEADFQNAAAVLGTGISVNLIKAFATVESGGRSGFGPARLPVIAFEGHIFRKYTQQKYDRAYPFLSYPYLEKAGPQWWVNNKDQAKAWQTLVAAFTLDQKAALMSASYGMFQIMGFNFALCGYKSVFEFVTAQKLNASQQLMAFVGFCRKTPALLKAMRNKDFTGMARHYNGADYGDYDRRIRQAFEALERKK